MYNNTGPVYLKDLADDLYFSLIQNETDDSTCNHNTNNANCNNMNSSSCNKTFHNNINLKQQQRQQHNLDNKAPYYELYSHPLPGEYLDRLFHYYLSHIHSL